MYFLRIHVRLTWKLRSQKIGLGCRSELPSHVQKLRVLRARDRKGALQLWVCCLVLFSFSGITESRKLHKTWTGNN